MEKKMTEMISIDGTFYDRGDLRIFIRIVNDLKKEIEELSHSNNIIDMEKRRLLEKILGAN